MSGWSNAYGTAWERLKECRRRRCNGRSGSGERSNGGEREQGDEPPLAGARGYGFIPLGLIPRSLLRLGWGGTTSVSSVPIRSTRR